MWLDVPACENGQERCFIKNHDLVKAEECLDFAEREYKECSFSSKRFAGRLGIYRSGLYFRRTQRGLKTLSEVFLYVMPEIKDKGYGRDNGIKRKTDHESETSEESDAEHFFISQGEFQMPDISKIQAEICATEKHIDASLTLIKQCREELKHTCLDEATISTKFQTFLESYHSESTTLLTGYRSSLKLLSNDPIDWQSLLTEQDETTLLSYVEEIHTESSSIDHNNDFDSLTSVEEDFRQMNIEESINTLFRDISD